MNAAVTQKAVDLAGAVAKGEISREDIYRLFSERIKKFDGRIKSFVNVYEPSSEKTGSSPLSGIPVAIKDNICIKGRKVTCASRILNSHISVYDATVVRTLKRAGLQIIGATNMDEFAFGSSTENSCYGPTRNPWDMECVPGGSSGGSAAAVAARLVPCALGSDTGGSIRGPAGFCGVVGFKPTYGRVSRFGLIAFGSSLDQIGTFTTNFEDCAHLLNILCGFDRHDSTSAKNSVPDFSAALVRNVSGLRIGLPCEYFREGLAPEVKAAINEVMELFRSNGAKIVEISLPHTEYAVAAYYIIACSEASANLQRFDGVKYGARAEAEDLMEVYTKTRGAWFGQEAKRRIFLGTYSLSSGYYHAYYMRALKVRTLIKKDFENAFREADVILTPTSPTCAFKLGEKTSNPLSMYLSDVYTISANLAGLPAVSFPCGFTSCNLPVGAQLMGKPFDEETLIRAGYTYQKLTDYHTRLPAVVCE